MDIRSEFTRAIGVPRAAGDTVPLEDYREESTSPDGEVLIYQNAIGWPQGERLVRRSGRLTVIRHHNITPASFGVGHSKLMEPERASWTSRDAAVNAPA